MSFWVYTSYFVAALWLELVFGPLLSIGSSKPSLLLLTVLLLALRHTPPWIFILGTLAGLARDLFSHGLLGLYGISFFVTVILARWLGLMVYERNALFTFVAIGALATIEGGVALFLMNWMDPTVPWWGWLGTRVIPLALFHAVLAIPVAWAQEKLENRFQLVQDN